MYANRASWFVGKGDVKEMNYIFVGIDYLVVLLILPFLLLGLGLGYACLSIANVLHYITESFVALLKWLRADVHERLHGEEESEVY